MVQKGSFYPHVSIEYFRYAKFKLKRAKIKTVDFEMFIAYLNANISEL